MARTALIYLAALTFAEFMFTGRSAQADAVDPKANEVVFEAMTSVKADGKDKAPVIMDFTKNPEADKEPSDKKIAGF